MTKRFIKSLVTIAFLAVPCIYAIPDTAQNNSDSSAQIYVNDFVNKLEIGGVAAIEEGQYVAGEHNQAEMSSRPWNHRMYGQLRLDAYIGDRLHVILNPQVKFWQNSYPITELADRSGQPFRQYTTFTLENAEGIYKIGDVDNPLIELAAGVFTYKYNPDSRNLGEYMFRTGTHPAYIVTSFDYAHAILPGFRASLYPLKNLYIDALLTTETQVSPLGDWSLSFLAGYKTGRLFDVGAGVSFERLFTTASDSVNSPKYSANGYLTSSGEQKYYSFGGTKLMARASFDPKSLLPEDISGLLGKEDCKLYAEAAILGLNNTTAYMPNIDSAGDTLGYIRDTAYASNYYSKLWQRIPIMIGFNVPCFKLFDVLSLEVEYYQWPYPNSYFAEYGSTTGEIPVPTKIINGRATAYDYTHDSWKWSIYAKKTIVKGFSVVAQFSRDHTHHDIFSEAQRDDEEIFTKNKHWGWWTKLQYNF